MLTETEHRLINYLKRNAYGKENAVRRSQIIRDLDIPDRELRETKGRIVREHGIPIGSTNQGYWYASNDNEIMNFRNYYHSLFEEHLGTSKAYEQMVEGNQSTLF